MVRNLFAFLTLLVAVDAGAMNVNLQLGTNKIGLQSSYQFTLTLSTPLQDASTVYFDFDASLGVVIPNQVVCNAITGFSSNPQCTRISDTRIAMACTTRLGSTYPNYALQINGITNPGSAMSLTNQISVSSYIGNSLLDQSSAIYVTYQANNVDSSKGTVQSLRPTVSAFAPFKATLKVENKIPSNGQIILKFPKWDNPELGPNYLNSMVSPATVTSCSSPLNAPTCSVQLQAGSSLPDTVVVRSPFALSGSILPGTTIEVTIMNVRNPPTLQPRSGFEIHTADSQGNLIDRCVNLKLTLTTAATATLGASYVTLSGQQGLHQPGTYQFFYQISSPIPSGGSLQLTLPPQVSIADLSLVQYTGLANIATSLTLVAGSTASQVKLTNSIVSYLMSGSGIMFTLNGITNPSSVETTNSFIISTFDEANFAIETLSQGLTVQAKPGRITGLVFQPSLNGIRQYVTEFTVKATIETKLDSTAVIMIELSTDPQSFQIVSDQQCTVLGMNQGVVDSKINCNQNQKSRLIVITGFVLDTVAASSQLSFKIQNLAIRNPVSVRYAATVSLYTSNALYRLDTGTSAVFYAVPSELLSVHVTPSVFYTGLTNVEYLFTVQAPGSIPQNAFVQVIFPPDVHIQNPNATQNSCNNYFKSGLPSLVGSPTKISCEVVQHTQVELSNLFQYGSSGDSTTFQFTLPGIQNPRAVNQATSSFQVFIFEDTKMQYGVYNLTSGITVTMLSPSQFNGVNLAPSSYTNRNSSAVYQFNIQTLATPNTTDTITVKFPEGITLPQNPTCKGDAVSLNSTLECLLIAADTLKLTLKFQPFVTPPSQFWFQVGNISNPQTTRPTDSFQIVYRNFLGNKVQEQTGNLTVQMKNGAVLPQHKMQITPNTFDSGVVTSYLVSYELTTIQDGMYVEIDFPVDIQILLNATCLNDIQCALIQQPPKSGLKASLFHGQTIKAQSFSGFTIVGVRNPIEQVAVVVSLRSMTSDGYLVEVINDFKLDFQCVAPCVTCVQNSNTVCASCDPLGKSNLFEGMCYEGCPPGYYLYEEQCLQCQKPCLGCVAWRNCTTCSDTSVYINELCVAETTFSYFCPALIISVLWIMTAGLTKQIMESGLCKCPKKNFNIIPIVIHGLCWANQLLVVIEILVYYTYNMQGVMAGEIVFGIIFPITITVVFIVLYFKWVHRDEQVQKHLNDHKALSYYALASCIISIRCWKLLYSEIGKSTSLTALRDKFKKQNMHFSFACLVPDIFLAVIGAAAMQVGIQYGINLIILLACERIIISSALLMSTLMEYSFKKTEKGGRPTIEVNSVYQDNSQSDLRSNINDHIETAMHDHVVKGGGDLSVVEVTPKENQIFKDFDSLKNKNPLEGMGEQEKIDRALNMLAQVNSSQSSIEAPIGVSRETASYAAKRKSNSIVDDIMRQSLKKSEGMPEINSSGRSDKKGNKSNRISSQESGKGINWDQKAQSDRKSGLVKEEDNFQRGVKVIYSDRSDTSVEELMEVTPSAFNEPNGRVNAESTGLRGLKEINIQGRSTSHLAGFQKGQIMNELNDDDKPVVSSIQEVNYRTATAFSSYGDEVHQVVTQFLANGEKTVITKKISETSRQSQAKKIQGQKKFVEDLSNRSSSNSKAFGQRKLTTPDESKTESLFTRTGKHSLDQSHRVLPKGPKP